MARAKVAPSPPAPRRPRKRSAPPAPPPPKRPVWKSARLWLLVSLATVALLVARLLFVPATDSVAQADAVVVFDGTEPGQLSGALALMNRQVAPVLVLPGGHSARWPEANNLCAGGDAFEVVCPEGEVGTDRAVARLTGQLATERSWQRVVVVAPTSQLSRVTLLTRRCTSAAVARVGTRGENGTGWRAPGELLHYLGAVVVDRAC